MQKIIQKILAGYARAILKKYQPKIIGITGSIGKTSTREAIYAVMQSRFSVRRSQGNYNNELGVPLTIIGAESAGRSVFGWLKIFFKSASMLRKTVDYPEILVLEMGADHPGDIAYLTKLAPCNVGVATKVGPAHLEYFGNVNGVLKEKRKIVEHLSPDGFAVLNYDDELVRSMAEKTKARIITYGLDDGADVRGVEIAYSGKGLNIEGINFKISYQGKSVPMFLPRVFGEHQLYSALAAAGTGIAFGINLVEVGEGLKNYQPPKGRMNIIPGIKDSVLIDDTYNSSPQASQAATRAIGKLETSVVTRKVAILGDMLELGETAEQEHYELGKAVAEAGFQLLIAVGQYRDELARGARENGLKGLFVYENSDKVLENIEEIVRENDLILLKGSQGARIEKITKALMKDKSKAKDLLVRQDGKWV